MSLLLNDKVREEELVTAPNSTCRGNSITHPVMGEKCLLSGKRNAETLSAHSNAAVSMEAAACVGGGACPRARAATVRLPRSGLHRWLGPGQLWVKLACFNPCERQPTWLGFVFSFINKGVYLSWGKGRHSPKSPPIPTRMSKQIPNGQIPLTLMPPSS